MAVYMINTISDEWKKKQKRKAQMSFMDAISHDDLAPISASWAGEFIKNIQARMSKSADSCCSMFLEQMLSVPNQYCSLPAFPSQFKDQTKINSQTLVGDISVECRRRLEHIGGQHEHLGYEGTARETRGENASAKNDIVKSIKKEGVKGKGCKIAWQLHAMQGAEGRGLVWN